VYYSDIEFDDYEDILNPLFAGDCMDGTSKNGKLFVISGPSGVGKTTLAKTMLFRLGRRYDMERVITYTTKQPREGEIEDVDYYYLSINDFKTKLSEAFFIEYSEAYGNFYGSPRSIIAQLKMGKSFVLVVDQVGAYKIKEQYADAVLVWVVPPTIKDLKIRLQARNTDLESDVNRRLGIAEREMAQESRLKKFDYVIVNSVLNKAKLSLEQILTAELQGPAVKS
jgi:guanylate kinase